MRCYEQMTIVKVGAKLSDSSTQDSLPKRVNPFFFQGFWKHRSRYRIRSNHAVKSVKTILYIFGLGNIH